MGYEQIITAAAPVANNALGMIGQRGRTIRYNRQSEKLMGLQVQNQMKLDKYGQQLQMETWKNTSYPAQIAMMKEAGLNPALMYGQAGGGGVTGSQGGGSASMGNAAPIQPWISMDLGNAMATMASIKLTEAQTKKAEAEAKAIETTAIPEAQTRITEAGYRIENLKAVTENEKAKNALIEAQTQWQNIQNNVANQTAEELVKQVMLNNSKLSNEVRTSLAQANVSESTINSQIAQIENTAVLQGVMVNLQKQNILKSQAETKEAYTKIQATITGVIQDWTRLNQDQQKITISKMLAEFNTNTPSHIAQWTGIIGSLINGAKNATSDIGGGGTVIKGFGR